MSTPLETLVAARELLRDLTPLKTNCGRICGGACCQPDPEEEGENGMLLLPGEEKYYLAPIEGFPFRLIDDDTLFEGGKRFVCEGKCVREHRPLACRIFPLRMSVKKDGQVEAEIDPRAWWICPLCEQGGLRAMSGAFVEAVKQAGEKLCEDPQLRAALVREQQMIDETRHL